MILTSNLKKKKHFSRTPRNESIFLRKVPVTKRKDKKQVRHILLTLLFIPELESDIKHNIGGKPPFAPLNFQSFKVAQFKKFKKLNQMPISLFIIIFN